QTGVAPGTNLIGAKVLDAYGSGYLSNCILGFEWAVNNGARIISFSAGSTVHDPAFTTTINNVVAAGVLPVIAAGNSGPGSSTICCPGDEFNSCTVGATDSSDAIAYFSSRGPVTLDGQTYVKPDVSAPGVSITSTFPGGGYETWDGTSMATPHVSGTAALILQNNPAMKPADVQKALESTAVDLGSAGKDNDYGSGRIDALKVIGGGKPVANFSANPTEGKVPSTVAFTDTSTGNPTSWKWSFGDGTTSTQQNPTHKYSKVGSYTVKLTATNDVGSNTITKAGYIKVVTKPVASFSAKPTSGKAPLTVAFTDKSTGIPTAWKWSFGDGASSTEQSPKHEYSQEGSYKVTLTVTNVAGTSTLTKTNFIKVTTNTRPGIYSENK
ncbi:S8 family serine peptidase, partial [Methanosarcina sp. UBA5]|uniref:S8 family serine peptidase n=1 Tax=Methanosarcina sp. UBA5 TaxID=1915593 RepID=UPI0025F69056